MSSSYPSTGAWGQHSFDIQQQQYPQHPQQSALQQGFPAPAGYLAVVPNSQYPSAVAAAAPGPAGAWQQPMQAPPAGQHQAHAAAQPGSSSSDPNLYYPQQHQHQHPQHQQPEFSQQAQHQQEPYQEGSSASGVDGSRGLGTGLMGGAHQVHKVGLAMHHVAHPVQGLKFHTVDKVKRKMKGKVYHLVDKVMP